MAFRKISPYFHSSTSNATFRCSSRSSLSSGRLRTLFPSSSAFSSSLAPIAVVLSQPPPPPAHLKGVAYKKKDVYLDGLILKTTRNISIISVPHNKRPEGKSNYNFFKLLSLWSNMAVNFPIFPLRLSTMFGLILLLIIVAFRKILAIIARKSNEQYIICLLYTSDAADE